MPNLNKQLQERIGVFENAIFKAQEAGYVFTIYPQFNEEDVDTISMKMSLLDPLFWQSLIGKDVLYMDYAYGKHRPKAWLKEMHSFIDHIAQGGDIDEFFSNLLK